MRYRKFKKAQMGSVVKIVLLVISAILIISAVIIIMGRLTDQGGIETCRTSVLAQAATKVLPTMSGAKSAFNIECIKRYVTFYNNRVELGWNKDNQKVIKVNYNGRKVTKIPELTDYVVNQIIAEEMRVCFYEMGEGKLKVFEQSIWKDNDICYVCSEINFKDLKSPKEFTGFMDYINRTYITNEKMTYYQYFDQPSLSVVPWHVSMYRTTTGGTISFDSKNSYFVMFIKEDKKISSWLTRMFLSPLTGVPSDVTAFKLTWDTATDKLNNYHVYVVNQAQLNDMCEIEAT